MCDLYIAHYINSWYTDCGGDEVSTSEAQKKATIKYMSEKLQEIRFRVTKEQAKQINEYANSLGKSTRAYIISLIKEDMEKAGHSLE